MPTMERFSTDSLDPRDRLNQLLEGLSRYGCGMPPISQPHQRTYRIDSANQGRLFAEIEYIVLNGLHFARIRGSACRFYRAPGGTVTSAPHRVIIAQRVGISRLQLDDEVVNLPAGSWLVADLSRMRQFTHESHFEHLLICAKGAPDVIPDTPRGLAQPVSRHGTSRVFYDVLLSFFDEIPHLDDDASRIAIKCMFALCRAALHESRASDRHELAARRLKRETIAQFVITHLADHKLSVDSIAHAFHCSTRTLQRIFSDAHDSEPLNRYIWRSRIERSAIALMTSTDRNGSITEIAQAHGFGSVAHFSRLFRKNFNMSPTEYRRRALPPPPQAFQMGIPADMR